jgi:hypothetical protein
LRTLFLRPAGGTSWSRHWLAASGDYAVAGPVDVTMFGSDLRLEQHLGCEGELVLAARPATRVTVRVEPPPPALQAGCELELEATHPTGGGFEVAPGIFTRGLAADGSATLGLPFDGIWQVQLWVGRTGAPRAPVGEPVEVRVAGEVESAASLKVGPAAFGPYR